MYVSVCVCASTTNRRRLCEYLSRDFGFWFDILSYGFDLLSGAEQAAII